MTNKDDDIIANEEEEIKKIIEEAEKAVKDKKQETGPETKDESTNDSKDFFSWLFVGVAIAIVLGSVYIWHISAATPTFPELTGALAAQDPSGFLSDWKLENSYTTLAAIPIDRRKELLSTANIADAATWEFRNGEKSIFVWLKKYDSKDDVEKADDAFNLASWRPDGQSILGFGDKSLIGIYKITGSDPLMAFAEQDKYILTVAYYNKDNEKYDITGINGDRVFIASLAKQILSKALLDEGKELTVKNINI